MKTSNSNVIVYVKQPVQGEQTRAISDNIRALRGVVNAQHSRRAPSMICVDYDPRTINSKAILQCVSDQGFPARLVGI
jgi:hypothetical protein